MSFSSSLSQSPLQRNRHSRTLSEALVELGFEPAKTQNYDWMVAYPDAKPLLEEIRTGLDPSSVLSASEAEQLNSVTLSYKKVSPGDIIDTAQPLVNAPFLKDVRSTRESLLASARNRVNLLKAQREVLREAVRQKREESESSKSLRHCENDSTIREKASQLRSTTDALKQFATEDLDILRNDSEMIHFCDLEAKHCETVASVFTQGFREDLKTSFNFQANATTRTNQAINTYAKLKHMQCMYRALVIRDAAMMASLGTNDGRYLEMTTSSMQSLIKELRSNAAKAMQLKANKVSEEARESLRQEVNLFSLSERSRQQDAYVEAMRQCLSLYLEQRLRIHCLQVVANRVTGQRDRILNLLRSMAPDISSVTICGTDTISKSSVTSDVEGETETGVSPHPDTEEGQELCTTCKNDKYVLEDLEDKMFSTHVESVASQISSITRNTGESSSWLRLSSNPQYDGLVKELEDELGKNTTVLEALLQKKATIVDKASSSSQGHSPSHRWISRINASRSPKHSSYSSYSSR